MNTTYVDNCIIFNAYCITDLNDWKVCAHDVNMSDERKEPTFSEQKKTQEIKMVFTNDAITADFFFALGCGLHHGNHAL